MWDKGKNIYPEAKPNVGATAFPAWSAQRISQKNAFEDNRWLVNVDEAEELVIY